jgi:hypothetical protein
MSGIFGSADNLTATIVAGGAMWIVAKNSYTRTLGLRSDIRKKIYRTSLNVNDEYLRNLLGPPVQGALDGGSGYLNWFLESAMVGIRFSAGMATRLEITALDNSLRLALADLPYGQFKGHLGRNTYRECVDHEPTGQVYVLSARRVRYLESYYFGNPGCYLYYALAYNDASDCGKQPTVLSVAATISGEFADGRVPSAELSSIHEGGRPNTIIISSEQFRDDWALQLDLDSVRLFAGMRRIPVIARLLSELRLAFLHEL